jgi:hypothetical protein
MRRHTMNLSDMLKNAEVAVPCPNCREKVTEKLGRLQSHDQITCPACGKGFWSDSRESIQEGFDVSDNSLSDLKRTISETTDE